MRWPDIFFRARKPVLPSQPATPPVAPSGPDSANAPVPEPVASAPVVPRLIDAPSVKPIPVALKQPASRILPSVKKEAGESSMRTLPATHGVVLRPPVRPAGPKVTPAAEAISPPSRLKNIDELMAEADPVHTLRQTGSLRVLKHPVDDPDGSRPAPAPIKLESTTTDPVSHAAPSTVAPAAPTSVKAADAPFEVEATEPAKPVPMPKEPLISESVPAPKEDESPFILKPTSAVAGKETTPAQAATSRLPFASVFRRKAKMTDVARIVPPSKRDDSEPAPASVEPAAAVVPPAFPVPVKSGRLTLPPEKSPMQANDAPPFIVEGPIARSKAAVEKAVAAHPSPEPVRSEPPPHLEAPASEAIKVASVKDAAPRVELTEPASTAPTVEAKVEAKPVAEIPDKPAESKHAPAPAAEAKPVHPVPEAPKVEPEMEKPKASSPSGPPNQLSAATSGQAERREFHLANGERIVGAVISETPEAIYIAHGTMGVITIPRAQIAKRLVEIILINGDRIVGDIMAETADTLYVRHSSLGMLTVPRAQRSTRVVEAILKDGDRILGEVLAETETATVIRSATLGTVTVPHANLAMLNRKLEQIELKALPPSAPELRDKPVS